MGFGHASGRELVVGGNDAHDELTYHTDGPTGGGTTVRVYATNSGIQVGCTFVSREAFKKLAKMLKDRG